MLWLLESASSSRGSTLVQFWALTLLLMVSQIITIAAQTTNNNLPTLQDAKYLVQEAPCSPLNTSFEGALVHVVCPVTYLAPLGSSASANTNDPLLQRAPSDQRFGVRVDAYMQVYQWEEYQYTKKVGNRNQRDFLYFREFYSIDPPRNTSFHQDGRQCPIKNGGRPCYQWHPRNVEPWWNASGYQLGWSTVTDATMSNNNDTLLMIGDYALPDSFSQVELDESVWNPSYLRPACGDGDDDIDDCPNGSPRIVNQQIQTDNGVATIPMAVWQQLDSNGEYIDYLTRSYTIYQAETMSILAVQQGNSFVPWSFQPVQVGKKDTLFEFLPGEWTALEMIAASSATSTKHSTARVWQWWMVGMASIIGGLLVW